MKLSVSVGLCMPEVDNVARKMPERSPIEDRVREAISNIESNEDSYEDWLLINGLYRRLTIKSESKRSERVSNLIDMIEPVLAKYGYHGVAARRV